METNQILREGWLWKRGKYSGVWRKRYFTLNRISLKYFLEPNQPVPRGELFIGPSFVVRVIDDCVLTKRLYVEASSDSYLLATETEGDCQNWFDAILSSQELYDGASLLSTPSISRSYMTPSHVQNSTARSRFTAGDSVTSTPSILGGSSGGNRRATVSNVYDYGGSVVHGLFKRLSISSPTTSWMSGTPDSAKSRTSTDFTKSGTRGSCVERANAGGASMRLTLLAEKCQKSPTLAANMVSEQYERAELFLDLHGGDGILFSAERAKEFDTWRSYVSTTRNKDLGTQIATQALLVLTLTQVCPEWSSWKADGEVNFALVSPESIISALCQKVDPCTLVTLREALSFPDSKWVKMFMSLGGLDILLDTIVCLLELVNVSMTCSDFDSLYESLSCLRALVKNPSGMNEFVKQTSIRTLNRMCRVLQLRSDGLCQLLFDILTSMCQYDHSSHFLCLNAILGVLEAENPKKTSAASNGSARVPPPPPPPPPPRPPPRPPPPPPPRVPPATSTSTGVLQSTAPIPLHSPQDLSTKLEMSDDSEQYEVNNTTPGSSSSSVTIDCASSPEGEVFSKMQVGEQSSSPPNAKLLTPDKMQHRRTRNYAGDLVDLLDETSFGLELSSYCLGFINAGLDTSDSKKLAKAFLTALKERNLEKAIENLESIKDMFLSDAVDRFKRLVVILESSVVVPPPPPPPPKMAPPPPPPPRRGPPKVPIASPMTGPKPSKKMKQLHWEKLPDNRIAASRWTERVEYDGINYAEVEECFAALVSSGRPSGKRETRRSSQCTVLDMKRATSIGIQMARMRLPWKQMPRAIYRMGEDAFQCVEDAQTVMNIVPTPDESVVYQGLPSSKREGMVDAERFSLAISKIARVRQRLNILENKFRVPSLIKECEAILTAHESSQLEIKSSKLFQDVLRLTLSLGNFMNYGTRLGSARGYRLSSLLRLKDTRASSGQMTLLHYVVKTIIRNNPESKCLSSEMPAFTSNLIKTSLDEVSDMLQRVHTSLEKAKTYLEYNTPPLAVQFEVDSSCRVHLDIYEDAFHSRTLDFVSDTQDAHGSLEVRLNECRVNLASLLTLYGESAESQASLKDFSTGMASFVSEYAMVYKHYQHELKERNERERRKTAQALRAKARSAGIKASPKNFKRDGYGTYPMHEEPDILDDSCEESLINGITCRAVIDDILLKLEAA